MIEKLSAGEDCGLSPHVETPERQEHGSIQSWWALLGDCFLYTSGAEKKTFF